jgi:ABC-type glycerol-3-phosphate transport system substrate-binding protein
LTERKGLSRREFLKTLGVASAGTAVIAAGVPAMAASDSSAARAQSADVTLLIAGWPYAPLPAEAPEGGYDAYQQALSIWLEQNPNVKMESVEVGIWDTSALLTAIAGGTAPAYFSTGVIGNWNVAGMQAAYLQGLVANISEQFEAYGIGDKLSDIAKAGRAYYAIGDDEYGVMNEIAPGNGVYYRKDLLAAAGLPEPTVDWTWDDVREIAKALTADGRRGIAMQGYGLSSWMLGAEGLGGDRLFARVPDPASGWNWKWDYTSQQAAYETVINRYRAMMFEDQSILSDVSAGDGSIAPQFLNQEVAMMTNPSQFYTRTSDPWPYMLAQQLGKPMEEVVGFMSHPRGLNGHINPDSRVVIPPIGLNPDMRTDEKNAAISLYNFMDLEEGFDLQRRLSFEASGDLKQAFAVFPFARAKDTIDGVDGTAADAWGADFLAVLDHMATVVSRYPELGLFVPPEETVGPTDAAWNDAASTFSFEPGTVDIPGLLLNAQDVRNQQAQGFVSSVSDDEFKTAAAAYYAAHDAYWADVAPDFYANTFKPWYDSVIVPALA